MALRSHNIKVMAENSIANVQQVLTRYTTKDIAYAPTYPNRYRHVPKVPIELAGKRMSGQG